MAVRADRFASAGSGRCALSSSARSSRYSSNAAKKNARSRSIGPPSEPPPWFHVDVRLLLQKKRLGHEARPFIAIEEAPVPGVRAGLGDDVEIAAHGIAVLGRHECP